MESSKEGHENPITKGQWQWKSNLDPWSKSEEPRWTSYHPQQNYLIEKAYYEQKEAELGEHIVSPQHKLQKRKDSPEIQRPIRRIRQSEAEENERSERYHETELPKTINKVFGSLEDFMNFFSRRNPEILKFVTQFKEIEERHDLDALNTKIKLVLIDHLQEEMEKVVAPSSQKLKERMDKINQGLISIFKKRFSSFNEFYEGILKAYTMNAFLYQNLNKYLRNEDWIELNDLLPYAFCVCKAFFNFKDDPYSNANLFTHISEGSEIVVLYRGTALDESALCHYNTKRVRNFSWHAVTSTTTDLNIANKFMYGSADIEKKKYPVLFIIEIDVMDTKEEYLKYLDVKEFSAKRDEEEVILPPGSVFELQDIETDEHTKITTIHVKLMSNIRSLAHQGLIMPGAMQTVMMCQEKERIISLGREALFDRLTHISGNLLLREVEFYFCKFYSESLKKLFEILPTIKNLQKMTFMSCSYLDEVWIEKISEINVLASQNPRDLTLKFIEKSSIDKNTMRLWTQIIKHLNRLNFLNLDFHECPKLTNDTIDDIFKGLKDYSQLASININFSFCKQMTDTAVNRLCSQGLKLLPQLTSLTLGFSWCQRITDKGVYFLCAEGLQHLTQLTSLSLDFEGCDRLSDEGLKALSSLGLKNLTQLTILDLNFYYCKNISDEGLNYLSAQGLKKTTQLASLRLNFSRCSKIKKLAVENLWNHLLDCHMNLTSLNLGFAECNQVKIKGINERLSQTPTHFLPLTSLSLDFSGCPQISIEEINNLYVEVLENFSNLIEFELLPHPFIDLSQQNIQDFNALKKKERFREQFIFSGSRNGNPSHKASVDVKIEENYKVDTLFKLVEFFDQSTKYDFLGLSSASFHFQECYQAIDTGLHALCSRYGKHLEKLRSLDINFSNFHHKFLEKGIEGLGNLSELKFLKMNFEKSLEITDETIKLLCTQGLGQLPQLISLTLSFGWCQQITDQGINYLWTAGLKQIPDLKFLSLNFQGCTKITHIGLSILSIEGFPNLTKLRSASLDFSCCDQITNFGINILCSQGFKQLHSNPQEEFLKKIFIWEPKLNDGPVEISPPNCQIKSLFTLPALFEKLDEEKINQYTLSFPLSWIFTFKDKDIQHLKLNCLMQLTDLHLDYSDCAEITNEGINNLCKGGLEHLTQLRSLKIDLKKCSRITDQGLNNLCTGALKYLTQLTTFDINLSTSGQITDKGISILCTEGLRYLSGLRSLTLNFFWCRNITDGGIESLCSEGFKCLARLTCLDLNFSRCHQITQKGVNSLCNRGLKNLKQLTDLKLNFSECSEIADSTRENIFMILYYLGFKSSDRKFNP